MKELACIGYDLRHILQGRNEPGGQKRALAERIEPYNFNATDCIVNASMLLALTLAAISVVDTSCGNGRSLVASVSTISRS